MRLIWQNETWVQPIAYCVGTCTCGNNCRENTELHTQITGALTSDEYSSETPCVLPTEVDDTLFEFAMATLGGG